MGTRCASSSFIWSSSPHYSVRYHASRRGTQKEDWWENFGLFLLNSRLNLKVIVHELGYHLLLSCFALYHLFVAADFLCTEEQV